MKKKKELASREGYGKGLVIVGRDPRVLALDADLSKSTMSALFQEKYPDRFINVGIAEQNLFGVSAGLATLGFIPFASTFASFVMRGIELIENIICYSNLNVKICGSHSGIDPGEDGPTHHATSDMAMMRAIPNIVILVPADWKEAIQIVRYAFKHTGPVYIRTFRSVRPIVIPPNYKFKFGKAQVIKDGTDVTLIATGIMVPEAEKAADILEKRERISTRIVNMSTIKPLDEKMVLECADDTDLIITCEDHSIIGGLGGAVAEVLAEVMADNHAKVKLRRIGVRDEFTQSAPGKVLMQEHGLSSDHIVKVVANNL